MLSAVAALFAVACDEEYVTYSDAEYVMFAEQQSTNMVLVDQEYFSVPVASTVACDYDRTFGVEVIDKGSNAIEGKHYRLLSNSVTIPAGELAADVKVAGIYENIEPTDSLGFVLKLVMPEQLKFNLYEDSDQTKVVMYKSCPFDRNNFTGWCVLTSLLLRDYPGDNVSYQRLIRTEAHPTENKSVILRSCFYDGYDVTITFNPEDPANPLVTMDKDQIISDEASVFGQILGDNKILTSHSNYYPSYFNSCQRFVELWNHVYVENLGETIGTVGHYYNILEWISDEEAERLQREGM
jgi:hypothetical protein